MGERGGAGKYLALRFLRGRGKAHEVCLLHKHFLSTQMLQCCMRPYIYMYCVHLPAISVMQLMCLAAYKPLKCVGRGFKKKIEKNNPTGLCTVNSIGIMFCRRVLAFRRQLFRYPLPRTT